MPWNPEDKYMWDFWFAEADGVRHLFYLQASHSECQYNPDNKADQASVGHAVLTDFGWQEVPGECFTKGSDGNWDDLAIWTGSVHSEFARHYMFYTGRSRKDKPVHTPHEWIQPQHIGLATSLDLYRWVRSPQSEKAPLVPNPGVGHYDGVAWRDPYIMKDEATNNYWLAICARRNPTELGLDRLDSGGAIVLLESPDIESWNVPVRSLYESDDFYQMEVPQLFWRRFGNIKRLYLLFCAQTKDCSRHRRDRLGRSECRTGTYWTCSNPVDRDFSGVPPMRGETHLLAADLYAGKLVNPDAEAPVFFGFIFADSANRFAGGLSDALGATFDRDGRLTVAPREFPRSRGTGRWLPGDETVNAEILGTADSESDSGEV